MVILMQRARQAFARMGKHCVRHNVARVAWHSEQRDSQTLDGGLHWRGDRDPFVVDGAVTVRHAEVDAQRNAHGKHN